MNNQIKCGVSTPRRNSLFSRAGAILLILFVSTYPSRAEEEIVITQQDRQKNSYLYGKNAGEGYLAEQGRGGVQIDTESAVFKKLVTRGVLKDAKPYPGPKRNGVAGIQFKMTVNGKEMQAAFFPAAKTNLGDQGAKIFLLDKADGKDNLDEAKRVITLDSSNKPTMKGFDGHVVKLPWGEGVIAKVIPRLNLAEANGTLARIRDAVGNRMPSEFAYLRKGDSEGLIRRGVDDEKNVHYVLKSQDGLIMVKVGYINPNIRDENGERVLNIRNLHDLKTKSYHHYDQYGQKLRTTYTEPPSPRIQPDGRNKPPVKPENKPPVKPENKPPVKPENKPPVKPENKPPVKPENKPPVKPDNKPPAKPENNKEVGWKEGQALEYANRLKKALEKKDPEAILKAINKIKDEGNDSETIKRALFEALSYSSDTDGNAKKEIGGRKWEVRTEAALVLKGLGVDLKTLKREPNGRTRSIVLASAILTANDNKFSRDERREAIDRLKDLKDTRGLQALSNYLSVYALLDENDGDDRTRDYGGAIKAREAIQDILQEAQKEGSKINSKVLKDLEDYFRKGEKWDNVRQLRDDFYISVLELLAKSGPDGAAYVAKNGHNKSLKTVIAQFKLDDDGNIILRSKK